MRNTIKHLGTHSRRFCVRLVCCVVLALVCAGAVFAQEESGGAASQKANVITLDLVPLVKGFLATDNDADLSFFCVSAAYERLIAPHYSIGVEVDLYPGKILKLDYLYFGLAAALRFYPMSEYMEMFFIGASLGFNSQSIDSKSKKEDGGFQGLFISLKAGYRIHFTETFFFEPSMSYTYSKTNSVLFGMTPQSIGWQGGLRIGVSF